MNVPTDPTAIFLSHGGGPLPVLGDPGHREIDEAEPTRRLVGWSKAPAARYCHPREEHLLPLHVCYGATRRACSTIRSLTIMGKTASLVIW
jgi:hypothetical protein